MAAEALRRGFSEDQIHIANYGIDRAEVDHARSASAGGTERYDGIFVGQFRPQKGLDDLVEIWQRVQAKLPGARLAVVGDGDGPVAVQFKRRLTEFSARTVTHLGTLVGADKYLALSRSSVFLFPSHHESWGLVALEAMAVGLPVIGFDIPSSREAFGEAMLQIPAFDIDAFADAVVRCLTNEKLRADYRRHGTAMAATYDWHMIAERFADDVLR
jgi:glycosyltransferase involved in cell wall biosynthesis